MPSMIQEINKRNREKGVKKFAGATATAKAMPSHDNQPFAPAETDTQVERADAKVGSRVANLGKFAHPKK